MSHDQFQQFQQLQPAPMPQYSAPQQPMPQYSAPQQPMPQYAPQQQQFQPAPMPQYAPVQPFQSAPQQHLAQRPVQGSVSAFIGQPKIGRAKAVTWGGKPDGYTVVGEVASDVTDRDIIHDTDMQTGALRFWRDGSPRYVMLVTLNTGQPTADFPEGQATLYVRAGDIQDKLAEAMTQAGRRGAPKAGDMLSVTLIERRAGQGAIPKNIFAAQYRMGGSPNVEPISEPASQPQPVAETPEPAPNPTPVQVPAPPSAPTQSPAPEGPNQAQADLLAKLKG